MHFASANQLPTWLQHTFSSAPVISSGKRKIKKSTESESPLKLPTKAQKNGVENLRKRISRNSRKRENISLQERLVDLQEVQMKALEKAQQKQHDFTKIIFEEQCQMDAAKREKDMQFLLQLGNFFSQK